MASSYRGLFRLGPVNLPTDVQVVDSGGISLPLSISDYISREVLPRWQLLPTEQQYYVLKVVAKLERGESVHIGSADVVDCQRIGWIEPSAKHEWVLTEAGRKLLE